MIVLEREELQQIAIGKDIVVSIIAIEGGRVKVGVEAPKNTHVKPAESALPAEPVLCRRAEWLESFRLWSSIADHQIY